MKYLFIVQGEGRGHLTQALAVSRLLREAGHTITEVLVGRCRNREIPQFFREKIDAPIYQYPSPTLDYGRGGKQASRVMTMTRNLSPIEMQRWFSSVRKISKIIKSSQADVIVNFYEFLMGPAKIIHSIDLPIISIGHQFLIDHPKVKVPKNTDLFLLRLSNLFSSYGSTRRLALSFYPLASSPRALMDVVPPLLRSEIFEMESVDENFILGYMLNPSYLDEVVAWKRRNPDSEVHLFWDKKGAAKCEERLPGLWLHTIDDVEFLRLMARCRGYVTTAGFESVCEALYLGKPTLMIPAHIEQQINAADAERVGAGATAKSFNLSLLERAIEGYSADTEEFRRWVDSASERILAILTDPDIIK